MLSITQSTGSVAADLQVSKCDEGGEGLTIIVLRPLSSWYPCFLHGCRQILWRKGLCVRVCVCVCVCVCAGRGWVWGGGGGRTYRSCLVSSAWSKMSSLNGKLTVPPSTFTWLPSMQALRRGLGHKDMQPGDISDGHALVRPE